MRRAALLLLLAALAGALLGACASPAQTPPDTSAEPSAAASAASPDGTGGGPESPLAGVVTAVDSRGLNDVRGFTLRTSAGEELQFVIGELENGDEFPPGHLTEHLAAASPVLVFFRAEGGDLVVYRIEDAG